MANDIQVSTAVVYVVTNPVALSVGKSVVYTVAGAEQISVSKASVFVTTGVEQISVSKSVVYVVKREDLYNGSCYLTLLPESLKGSWRSLAETFLTFAPESEVDATCQVAVSAIIRSVMIDPDCSAAVSQAVREIVIHSEANTVVSQTVRQAVIRGVECKVSQIVRVVIRSYVKERKHDFWPTLNRLIAARRGQGKVQLV